MNWPNHHSEYKFLFSPPRLRMMCAGNSAPIMWYPGILWKGRIVSSSGFHFWFQKTKVMPGDVQGTCGCFQKYGPSPQIIPFVHRVFHEMFTIHFGGKHPPYFWKHPCGCKKHLFQTWLPDEMNIHLVRDILDTISHTHTHTQTPFKRGSCARARGSHGHCWRPKLRSTPSHLRRQKYNLCQAPFFATQSIDPF